MTRDFNKQPRNDSRPSFRKPPSGRNGEERASRPARPRLNREIVDRAWESGAPQNHADYRSRSNTTNGQAPQNGRRSYSDGQKPAYPSQHGRTENRPYGNRTNTNNYQNRDNDRFGRRSDDNSQDRRPRSFDSDRRPQNPRFGDRRGYSDGPNDRNEANRTNTVRPPYQNNYRDNSSSQGPDRRNQDRPFNGPRRDFERDSRGPNRFSGNRDERPARGGYQGQQPTRGGYQGQQPTRGGYQDQRPTRGGYQDQRSGPARGGYQGQRPTRPYGQEQPARQKFDDTLFEGDYEGVGQERTPDSRLARTERPERTDRPNRDTFNHSGKPDAEERHVTRLPDGRVLKGPRPVQRKNADFWNEIAEDTDGLLNQVQVPIPDAAEEPEDDATTDEQATLETTEELATGTEGKAVRKPRNRVASAVARNKKAAAAKKPRSTGPRPSQRGFKWPSAPSESESE